MSKLHVSKFGKSNNAPVLALLHGWGSSSKVWQACIEELSQELQIWCVDLPGHGESHDIEWDESIEQGLILLANALPASCLLVGWSLGGLLAQLYTKHYPQRVQSLMLVASTPKFVASTDWPHAMLVETFERFVKQFDTSPITTLKQFTALQALHSISSKQIIYALDRSVSSQYLENIRWGLQWLQEIDLRDSFFSTEIPITLLQGENDQVSSVKAAEHTAEIWQYVSLYKIANAGHTPFLSHPERFYEQVDLMVARLKNNINVE